MSIIQKLNRLDEVTGLRLRSPSRRQWDRAVRLWWLAPVTWIVMMALAQLLWWVWDLKIVPMTFAFFGFPLFLSGFYYAHRLLELRRQSGIPSLRQPLNDEGRDPTA